MCQGIWDFPKVSENYFTEFRAITKMGEYCGSVMLPVT